MSIINIYLPSIFSLIVLVGNATAAENTYRLKDGRQYVLDLVRVLEVSHYEMRPLEREVSPNLPKRGDLSEFHSAKDSMAKLASFACNIVDELDGEYLHVEETYKMILGRSPIESEKKLSLGSTGKFNFYRECMILTMHPEFILIKR